MLLTVFLVEASVWLDPTHFTAVYAAWLYIRLCFYNDYENIIIANS